MVQLPKVNYLVKGNIFKRNLVLSEAYEMPQTLCKGHLKITFGTFGKHVPNFKPLMTLWLNFQVLEILK